MASNKNFMGLMKATVNDFLADKVMRHAAALAYYTVFSLGPILILVIAIAGIVWGDKAVRGEIVDQFSGTMGEQTGQQIQTLIQNAGATGGGWAMMVGIITLVVAATAAFAQLKDSLNTIWDVRPKPGRGVMQVILTRVAAFGVVVAIAFLLLATLVVDAVLSALGGWMDRNLPVPIPLLQMISFGASVGIVTLLFAALFKWLPDVRIGWRDVWVGALVTALLFAAGKFALGLYLGRSSAASVYGAAGSLVLILLWVYYTSLIFLFGAEFTQVYALERGHRVEPSAHAEFVTAEARAREGHLPKPSQQRQQRENAERDMRRRQAPRPRGRRYRSVRSAVPLRSELRETFRSILLQSAVAAAQDDKRKP